jgi:Ca2+-binding RTX toxin-like protein
MTIILSANSTTAQALSNLDDLFITAGVSLLVTPATAITGTGGSVQVVNYGTVFSSSETITFGALDSGDVSLVFNGLGGTITSGGFTNNAAAVFIQGYHSIENHGQIKGNMYVGTGIKTNDDGEVHNFGVISGRTGILNYGNETASNTIINHGTVHGTNASIWVQNTSIVTIVNYGLLDGAVRLGDGGSLFGASSLDSSEGAVRGSISGGLGDNFIASGRLGNYINGGGGNDTVMGNGGNDTIFGDDGNDLVSGDEGNDVITVANIDGTDTLDGGTGIDGLALDRSLVTMALTISIAAPSVVQELADGTSVVNFEQLRFTGGTGHDGITGGRLSDFLNGGAGNDTLNGGAGTDMLIGGTGADSYVVDRLSDTVEEDTVSTAAAERDTVTYIGTSGTYVLGVNVENLVLGGTAAINGTGNAAANAITGNAAANVLNGLTGVDTLSGMGGSDSYFVDVAGDVVVETIAGAAGGVDLVTFTGTTGTFTLGSNVENLTLTGSAAINGTGNTLANTIIGNSGSNVLSGGLGNDTLTGGLGNDFFVFNTAPNTATNGDTITDFNVVADTIRLENAVFTALGAATGALNAAMFKNASLGAVDASDRILYNDATGAVLYDIDGSGAAAAIQFATISGAPTLTVADFLVI